MQVEIWSDVVCPWCAIGKAHFEAALATFAHRDAVQVRWRSFELDPRAPRERPGDLAGHLASKYGVGRAQALAMMERVTQAGAAVGLEFRFERARTGNTFDAHRLLHLAADRGRQNEANTLFFKGYFTDGVSIGEPGALQDLAVAAGLDAAEVAAVLAGDTYASAVRADERRAAELGIRGVPFFLFEGQYGVSGGQPVEVFARALEQVWSQTRPAVDAGPACDDDGCALP